MENSKNISDVIEMLEKTRELAHTSSCVEIIKKCNDLIVNLLKIALKEIGKEAEGPYSLDQLREAGLPSWYLEAVHDACLEAGILPFCVLIFEVPKSREGCTKLDVEKALNATEKVVRATKEFLETTKV